MDIRKDTANHIRHIRHILRGSQPEPIPDELDESPSLIHHAFTVAWCMFLAGLMIVASCQHAHAYTTSELADAIFKTENSKSHPYGILTKYKHTTPRQACLNTINHRLRVWNGNGDFIVFLGLTYSPPAINPNWVRLVHYFLKKGDI